MRPYSANEFASLPPDVNIISSGSALIHFAILSLASSISTLDCLPSSWTELGFPKVSMCSMIAFLAASHMGVVAALSK